jgi:uncharacterized phage infection (PIP) family protein YhgE
MITLLREELAAGRQQQADTMLMMNQSLLMMHNMMEKLSTSTQPTMIQPTNNEPISQSTTNTNETASQSNTIASQLSESRSTTKASQETETTPNEENDNQTGKHAEEEQKAHNKYKVPPYHDKSNRRVLFGDPSTPMKETPPEHDAPGSVGLTPPPKRTRAGTNATSLQRKLEAEFEKDKLKQTTDSESAVGGES